MISAPLGHYQGQPGERGVEVRAWSSPPLRRLESAYAASLDRAHDLGAKSLACPSLGTGVKGWRPAISAAVGLDTVARSTMGPEEITVVLSGDDAVVAWRRVARVLLGEPTIDVDTWELDFGGPPLALSSLPELQPKPAGKAGWAGDHWRPTNAGW